MARVMRVDQQAAELLAASAPEPERLAAAAGASACARGAIVELRDAKDLDEPAGLSGKIAERSTVASAGLAGEVGSR
jgi:hypothetical protein